VTIDEIGTDGGAVVRRVEVSVNDPTTPPSATAPLVAFQPFTLEPDQARFVVVRYRFAGCTLDQPEEQVTETHQQVTYGIEIAGVTLHRSDELALPFSLRVIGDAGCP
jgi:hypothetical protein